MKTNFNRFQERNKIRAQAVDRGNTSFILNGYNSTIIKNGSKEINAAVVNQQEKDSAYIFTHIDEPLTIGSFWEAKSLHFLITEEIITIKDVLWHKYRAELCNTEIDGIWGRFIGPEEAYVNIALKEKTMLVSQQKPLIILPSGTLHFGDKIVIKNRPWLVQEYDDISTEGITYYSLTPTTVSKDLQGNLEHNTKQYTTYEELKNHIIGHNINITISTEDGYLQYDNPNINIISRNTEQVIFSLPFGVDQVTILTKQKGEVVTTTYSAK